ncbi:MAG TPA: DUF6448 family protein [Thermoanaerobaculia bacterium]|nr:DUF6448 family protein [Thermoanaerobaculia bacterium]
MKLTLACFLAVIIAAPAAFAHCDWIKGPVVADARAALAKGDVAPALKWVPAADEPEIRRAFARTLAARAGGEDARDVADQWFFETLVRVHRASEGEPFTGLKGADYEPEAGIEMADQALEASSIAEVEKVLTTAMKSELQKRFAAAIEAKKHADESVAAGRQFVHAYAEFIHYVEGVHRSVAQNGHHASP